MCHNIDDLKNILLREIRQTQKKTLYFHSLGISSVGKLIEQEVEQRSSGAEDVELLLNGYKSLCGVMKRFWK